MIFVKLTNGFGNNLFQYIAGRLLAEHHKTKIIIVPPWENYYGLEDLNRLDLKYDSEQLDYRGNYKIVNEDNYNYLKNQLIELKTLRKKYPYDEHNETLWAQIPNKYSLQ